MKELRRPGSPVSAGSGIVFELMAGTTAVATGAAVEPESSVRANTTVALASFAPKFATATSGVNTAPGKAVAAPMGTPVNTTFPDCASPASRKFCELNIGPRVVFRQAKPNADRLPTVPVPATEMPNAPRFVCAEAGAVSASPTRLNVGFMELEHACTKAEPPAASGTCCWVAPVFSARHVIVAVCAAAPVFLRATTGCPASAVPAECNTPEPRVPTM